LLVGGLIFFVLPGSVKALEKYPNRSIEVVVPFSAGGSADLATRTYTPELAQNLKTRIIVVNRPGASGVTGAVYVVRAKKDGYTLFAGGMGNVSVVPLISSDMAFNPLKDLVPVGYFGDVPSVFAVRADSPFKTLKELIDYARKNPGKLKNSDGGLMTASQFNLEILCTNNNINITTIPFVGGGDALVALLGGHVDMTSSSVTGLGPQIKAGKLRPLAIVANKRFPQFPDIPTTTELGYAYVSFKNWFGIFAASGTPQSALNVLVPAVEKTFKNPAVVERAAGAYIVVDYMGPVEFRKHVESEIHLVETIMKNPKMQGK
jgi:tripartite-type tricarboxylate transporter receptor subunit TctC